MEDCKKYKTKAVLGGVIFSFFLWERIFNFIDTDNFLILSIISLVIGIIALYLSLPYIRCLQDYNDKHKPPFQ